MRVVLQRVKHASVSIDSKVHGKIGRGYVLLVGVADSDGDDEIAYLAHKIDKLRIFEDDADRYSRRSRGNFVNFSVHTVCRYQEGQPAKLYESRRSRPCQSDL